MSDSSTPHPQRSAAGFFPVTRWSVVQRFQDESSKSWDIGIVSEAAEELCRTYWRPVFLHVQAKGLSTEDAQDITQQVFSSLFQTQRLEEVDESKGRLRSFLRAVANRHLAEFVRSSRRIKRGGDQIRLHIDLEDLEDLVQASDPGTDLETAFDRQWAEELMDRVAKKLEDSYASRDRAHWFTELFPLLTSPDGDSYSDLAGKLKATESAIRVGIHRMRKRYREMLRNEVGETVDSEEAIDLELRALYSALSRA